MTLNVFVPQEALAAYQSAVGWKNFWNLQGGASTGMKSIKNNDANANNNYYDLRGNKLNAPKHGLNIINGRKVMVK